MWLVALLALCNYTVCFHESPFGLPWTKVIGKNETAEYLHSHKESLIFLQGGWQLKKTSSLNIKLLKIL